MLSWWVEELHLSSALWGTRVAAAVTQQAVPPGAGSALCFPLGRRQGRLCCVVGARLTETDSLCDSMAPSKLAPAGLLGGQHSPPLLTVGLRSETPWGCSGPHLTHFLSSYTQGSPISGLGGRDPV